MKKHLQLLLIEDDEDDYLITLDLLSEIDSDEFDFQLDWAPTFEQAKAAFAKNTHDVCLLDYTLGANNGLSLLLEAPHLGYSGPIIMLTGQSDPRLDAEAMEAGAVDFLEKANLNAPRLIRAIRYAVARRQFEHERIERLKAESENRAKSNFLAHLSHELRTPLTAILGYTDIMLEKYDDPQLKAYLQITERNGAYLLSLLNDVLDLSKIEAGKLEIENKHFLLAPFLHQLYALLVVKAKDKQIDLRFSTTQKLPYTIKTDPTRLRQILINLIGNAIKFTQHGFVSMEIKESIQQDQPYLQFIVSDSGMGIPTSDIAKLFQPFSQVKPPQNSPEQGSGLGLAISYQLALSLSGALSVESQEGVGSTFTCQIPLIEKADAERTSFAIDKETNSADRYHKIEQKGLLADRRIVVADDIVEIRQLAGHILESVGAEVIYAANGDEVLKRVFKAPAKSKPIDLIILDINMPKLNGLSTARQLRTEGYTKPILALTASTMKGERERCLQAGCTEFMSKPFEPDHLRQTAATLLQLPHRTTENSIHQTKLLLIEDQPDARDATAELLTLLGWSVTTAHNGQSALSKCECLPPYSEAPIILLDLNLPDIDGRELSLLIQEKLTHAIIIAISGEALNKSEMEAYGIKAQLMKPLCLAKLRSLETIVR